VSFPAVLLHFEAGKWIFRARFARQKDFSAPRGINFPARDLRNRGTRLKKTFPAPPGNQEKSFQSINLPDFKKELFPGKTFC